SSRCRSSASSPAPPSPRSPRAIRSSSRARSSRSPSTQVRDCNRTERHARVPETPTRVLLGLAALVVVALAGCGGDDASSQVVGVEWQWGAVVYGEADPTAPPTPIRNSDDYLLTLAEDGSFTVKADCNHLRGTYTLSGSDLTLELGQAT